MNKFIPFFEVIKTQEKTVEDVKRLLPKFIPKIRSDSEYKNFFGESLQISTRLGSLEICKLMIDYGAEVDFLVISQVYELATMRLLLEYNPASVMKTPNVIYNVLDKPLEIVQYTLFKLGVRGQISKPTATEYILLGEDLAETNRLVSVVNGVDINCNRAITILARNSDHRVLRFLGELFGLDLEVHGPRILMAASRLGYLSIVTFLIQSKVIQLESNGLRRIVGSSDPDDNSPLIVAAQYGHIEIIKLLLDPESAKSQLHVLFITAAVHSRTAVMKYLFTKLFIRSYTLTRAILRAIEENQLNSVIFIIEVCQFDVTSTRNRSIGPRLIELAVRCRQPRILKYLINKGARITNLQRFFCLLKKTCIDQTDTFIKTKLATRIDKELIDTLLSIEPK